MTFENKKTLIIACLMIVFLILVSIWQVQRLDRLESPLGWPEMPKLTEDISMPSIDDIIKEAEKQFDFETEEKKSLEEISFQAEIIGQQIKFEYPAVWENMNPALVEEFTKIDYIDMKIIFFAYSKDMIQPLSFIVAEANFKNRAEALEQIESIYNYQDISMKIINAVEDSEQKYYFEAAYEKDNEVIYSKEKFIFLEDTSYLFSVFGLENALDRYDEIINHIFQSIQITENIVG